MKMWSHFPDWPLRAKLAALLVVASVLPLIIAAVIDIEEARARLMDNTAAVLTARGDQLVRGLDTFNRGYERSAFRVAHLPPVMEFCQAGPQNSRQLQPALLETLKTWPKSDANIRGMGILDLSGVVKIATESPLIGKDISYHSYVREALKSQSDTFISDVYLAGPEVGSVPTIAYLAPVFGVDGKRIAIAALWVRASALWEVMKRTNGLAGPDSFAVLFDHQGIRIGHTYSDEIVFHPGGQLAPDTINALVAERRFGDKTRQLLEDVRPFPQQFDRARAESPDTSIFRGLAPVNQQWNYGVGHRFETVSWTIFYMIPERSLNAQIIQMTWRKVLFALVIILVALTAGIMFALTILRPVRSLAHATQTIAGGDLTARVPSSSGDELGQLGTSFNVMAEKIQCQSAALQTAHDQLEQRVQERTAELKAANQANTRLAAIVQSSDDAIVSKTLDGVITSWNSGAEKLFGYSAEEAIGKPMTMLIPTERTGEESRILSFIARGESVDHFETVRLRKDKSRIDVSVTISPLRDEKGTIIGASKIARDISARKQAETKLQAQISRLDLLSQMTRAIGERQDLQSIFQVVIRSLEDNLPIDFGCICLYDQPGNALTIANVGVKSRPLADKLTMPERGTIPIDQNGLSQCVHGRLVYEPNVGDVHSAFPERLNRGGLNAVVIAPLLVEEKVFGVLIAGRQEARSFSSTDCEFLRQLSEHVALAAHQAQLYSALQRAYDDLRQTQEAVMQQERLRALGQMASGIAHDINNAITPVAIYTDTLLEREPNLTPRGRESLKVVQRAIDDVAATVARMREFYRDRGPRLALALVDLNQLARQVMELTRARWSDMPQERGIVIRVETDLYPELPFVMGVESEIREALTNLVFNAVDAMPEGGTLTLRTRVVPESGASGEDAGHPSTIQIEVSDTGVGMDEETRKRCLEPFFTTKGERGTGLGLAMVYGMVQRHSIGFEIESAIGQGTTMRLIFQRPASEIAAPTGPPIALTVPSNLRILLVDDDPVLLQSLRNVLEMDGHHIVATNGGQEGINAFRAALKGNEKFDAVITDLGMPYVDGRQVARTVKGEAPVTPVILLTGWGQRFNTEAESAEPEMPIDVDRILSKPPKLRELREALASCCSVSRR